MRKPELTVKEKQHMLEDYVDDVFARIARDIDRVIVSEDKEIILNLIGLLGETLITQLTNSGYIDVDRDPSTIAAVSHGD